MWPFSSSPTSPPTSTKQSTNSAKTQTQQIPLSSDIPLPSSKPLTRDEIADRELQSFLSELEGASAPAPPSKKYTRTPRPPPTQSLPSSTRPSISPSGTIASGTATSPPQAETFTIAEHLLPTSMSCRAAFDAAFYCNSFGGRFNDLYRYGTLRSCSETWNDFWFCMKTKSYSSPSKENAIRDHYREKEIRKYGGVRDDGTLVEGEGVNGNAIGGVGYRGRGSEDVWKSREELVKKGSMFREVVTGWERAGEIGNEEWNQREIEKRRHDKERYDKEAL